MSPDDEIDLQDQHVERLNLDDQPDLVVIQVYITNAYRAEEAKVSKNHQNIIIELGLFSPQLL